MAITFFIIIGCGHKSSQEEEKSNVRGRGDIKSELRDPYLTFSKGYRSLDSEIISGSYIKNGILINIYNNAEPKSYMGRKRIGDFFSENLDRAKDENTSLKIDFKISDRKFVNETVLDNGFYKIEILDSSKTISERFGKFSIVLKKEANQWKFAVDTNASSSKEEYQNAKSI